MKNLLTLVLFMIVGSQAYAQNAAIFSGGGVKILKDKLIYKTEKSIESGIIDPSAVATAGDQGSLYMGTSALYIKGDDGITTNWTLMTPYAIPILAKGSILTSDGAVNGEFSACADDEILVYDVAETSGIKCEAKPVAAVANYSFSAARVNPAAETGSGYRYMSPLQAAITSDGTKPVEIKMFNYTSSVGRILCIATCYIRITRNGTTIGASYVDGSYNAVGGYVYIDETPVVGVNTYQIQGDPLGSTLNIQYTKLSVKEF